MEEWAHEFAGQVLDIIQQFNQLQGGKSELEQPMLKHTKSTQFMPIQNIDSM